jgi:SAM-dependent methyltransferase
MFIDGWKINCSGGYYRAVKRLYGKSRAVYIGKEFDPKIAARLIRRKQQQLEKLHEPKLLQAESEMAWKNATHRAAKFRSKPSAPIQWLKKQGLLKGRILDYGCGLGFDADFIAAEKYDLNFFPKHPETGFDTIICNYVFNILEKKQHEKTLQDIKSLLIEDGTAYISVWRIASEIFTERGYSYKPVSLELPSIHKCSGYIIYKQT